MKKKTISIAATFIICVSAVCHADMFWEYESPLNIVEIITDIGGGSYRYEYSFTNIDSSTIWHFNIYTTIDIQPENAFSGYEKWTGLDYASVDQYGSTYDPRVLDDDIVGGVGTAYEYWGFGEAFGIQPNNYAGGLTYLSNIYDPSPKYYSYTTIATNGPGPYLQDKMSAVGQTIPEPSSLVLFGLGCLALRRRMVKL
jgi:hypothetical protein